MALRSYYCLQVKLYWKMFLYKHLREVCHYSSVVHFCPPTPISSPSSDYSDLPFLQEYTILKLQINVVLSKLQLQTTRSLYRQYRSI